MIVPITVAAILLQCSIIGVFATSKSVLLYSNLGQITSSTLLWETYLHVPGDSEQLKHAVVAAKYVSGAESYKMYVCRTHFKGILVSGHTARHHNRTVCIVSMHFEVHPHHSFELLLNKEHGGKLVWKPWDKFDAKIPHRAVSALDSAKAEDTFVARRKSDVEHGADHHHHAGSDYNVGRYIPNQSLGKVIVTVGDTEQEYENGQVLIELDPVRYEMQDINVDRIRRSIQRNHTILGTATLSNNGELSSSLVETVITYKFNRVRYWGKLVGVAYGLPTDIYETGKAPVQISMGVKDVSEQEEAKQVSANLQPGTAINVTMKGNYVNLEAPYKAKLITFYADSNESMSRRVEAMVQTADMEDVQIEFGPVYWTHNFTLVPTTTTTTTTTTTSTTTQATTTNHNPVIDSRNNFVDSNDVNAVDESRDAAAEINLSQLGGVVAKKDEDGKGAANGLRLDSTASVIMSICYLPVVLRLMRAQFV